MFYGAKTHTFGCAMVCILWDFWSVNNKLVYGIIIHDNSKYSLLNLHNIVKFDGVHASKITVDMI